MTANTEEASILQFPLQYVIFRDKFSLRNTKAAASMIKLEVQKGQPDNSTIQRASLKFPLKVQQTAILLGREDALTNHDKD